MVFLADLKFQALANAGEFKAHGLLGNQERQGVTRSRPPFPQFKARHGKVIFPPFGIRGLGRFPSEEVRSPVGTER
jgi:hypothetical protein